MGVLTELNHKVGVEGRDELKMPKERRGDDRWGHVLKKAEGVGVGHLQGGIGDTLVG